MATALKELEPFVRNGQHLETGKPFKNFGGMRSREILANWLLCAALNSENGRNLTFTSDPLGGDGRIYDCDTGESWPTEHVMVPRLRAGQTAVAEGIILEAVKKKRRKGGAAYASGKTLVVFLNADIGRWMPDKVARQLPRPLHFAAVWVVSFQGLNRSEYVYNLAHLDLSEGNAPAVRVRIGQNFDIWEVTRIQ